MTGKELYLRGLYSISPFDGREALFTIGLRQILSEGALHRYRAVVEVENLISLADSDLPHRPEVSDGERRALRDIIAPEKFDSGAVAEYDHFGRRGIGPLEHDVKSVEIYLRERLSEEGLGHLNEFLHFPMTSEDVNNLAYNLMMRDAVNKVWLPKILETSDKLADLAERHAAIPVLGKTHGMNASPTTVGKRFAYTLDKLTDSLHIIEKMRLKAKFSGPVGNHNAMTLVVPNFDMNSYARRFVESFGFEYSETENQRISHQEMVRLLGEVAIVNTFGADFCDNIRHNVMMGWLYQEGESSQVGSSVMPHKINPWFFEVGQGYFEIANRLIDGARDGLLMSTFERDLTDHPWERLYGEMFGGSLVGFSYISEGLDTLRVNDKRALEELRTTPEVLS
ncbi:MAG: lyase family protein, partial [Nanoarchaeota archaeon]|nr:lyase family protein [Nanoarchaeota archaeon]